MDDLYLDQKLIAAAQRLGDKMRQHGISLYLTGLAASGKSAVATLVSQLTGIPLVDSGLPFRLAAYLCSHVPAAREDLTLLDRLLNSHTIRIIGGAYHLFSGAEDLSARLRSPEVEADVPRIAGDSRLREIVLKFLRATTTAPAIVAARGATEPLTSGHLLQIELRTDFNERVRRRVQQTGLPQATVRRSIRERDERDMFGPSRYPSADYVNSTALTLEETVAQVMERATERIARLYEYHSFRRRVVTEWRNPLLERAWTSVCDFLSERELNNGVPSGHSKGRYLLHLSRFSGTELFGNSFTSDFEWPPGVFPEALPSDILLPVTSLLEMEAERIVEERRSELEAFFSVTRMPESFIKPVHESHVRRAGRQFLAEDDAGQLVERLDIRDASRELGISIEKHLHYLGVARPDTTHRIVLVEESTDLPVLYISFSPNSRKYFEPLLWAFSLRMEEVAVAVRGYGSPRCPKNAMGLFLRVACKRVSEDFPHLKAILTDINPNWGFTGNSFREAGFLEVGLKHAPTYFIGEEYSSRRSIEGRQGSKAASPHRLPLVPTVVMLKPLNEALTRDIKSKMQDGLYVVPRALYDRG